MISHKQISRKLWHNFNFEKIMVNIASTYFAVIQSFYVFKYKIDGKN